MCDRSAYGYSFFLYGGLYPYYITEKYLVTSLKESLIPGYDWDEVEEVHFYGAGCAEDKYDFMRNLYVPSPWNWPVEKTG